MMCGMTTVAWVDCRDYQTAHALMTCDCGILPLDWVLTAAAWALCASTVGGPQRYRPMAERGIEYAQVISFGQAHDEERHSVGSFGRSCFEGCPVSVGQSHVNHIKTGHELPTGDPERGCLQVWPSQLTVLMINRSWGFVFTNRHGHVLRLMLFMWPHCAAQRLMISPAECRLGRSVRRRSCCPAWRGPP